MKIKRIEVLVFIFALLSGAIGSTMLSHSISDEPHLASERTLKDQYIAERFWSDDPISQGCKAICDSVNKKTKSLIAEMANDLGDM